MNLSAPRSRILAAFSAAMFAASTASAAFVATNNFESALDPAEFTTDAGVSLTDISTITDYDGDEPSVDAPAPFANYDYGSKYLVVDTDDAMLWRTFGSRLATTYFDSVVKFSPTAGDVEYPADSKFVVFLDAATSNLFVVSGTSADDRTPVTNRLANVTIYPDTWRRLTVDAVPESSVFAFQVRVDGTLLETADATPVSTFYSLASGASLSEVGLKGAGAIDDMVVRSDTPYAATIGGQGYTSLEAALAAATSDSVVALAADHSDPVDAALALGASYKIARNGFDFGGFVGDDGVAVTESDPDANGVVTYNGVEGVAQCNGEWYATFGEAYEAALASQGNATMLVRISSDFTPSISQTYNHFYSLTFTNTTTGALTINLKNAAGTAYMGSERYFFPDNSRLVLATDFLIGSEGRIRGGTLEVPSGVTVSFGGQHFLADVDKIVGTGIVAAPSADSSYFLSSGGTRASSPFGVHQLFRDSEWRGTLRLGICTIHSFSATVGNLGYFGNSNSTIAFDGVTMYAHFASDNSASIGAYEVCGSGGLKLDGNYANKTCNCSNTLKGDGSLKINVVDTQSGKTLKTIQFSGAVSNFTGSISFDSVDGANACVVFGAGTKTATEAKTIEVLPSATNTIGASSSWVSDKLIVSGKLSVDGTFTSAANVVVAGSFVTASNSPTLQVGSNVTIEEGATWTVPVRGAIVHGDMTVNGNIVDVNGGVGKIYSNNGTAVVTANSPTAFRLGNISTWKGTYVIGWNPPANTFFNINDYGSNTESKIVFAGTWPEGTYFGYASSYAHPYTILAELQLDSPIVIGNGFSGAGNVVTLTKLSGSADFTTSRYSSSATETIQRYYAIDVLDNYTGKLTARDGSQISIGVVNVPAETDTSRRIVDALEDRYYTNVVRGKFAGPMTLKVGGSEVGTLVYDTREQGTGLYLKSKGAVFLIF